MDGDFERGHVERAPVGTAVIIGGSGGIGAASGAALRARGFDVVLVARNADRLAAAANGIRGARFVAADCTDAGDVRRVFDTVGQVGVLVHAAGVRVGMPVATQPVDMLDDLYAAHLRSVFLTVQAALPVMSAGSRVILTSSIAARRAVPGLAGYSAMKAGLGAFAASLSAEVADRGVGVYVVAPAQVDTPLLVKRWHCLHPADVAAAVAFLAGVDTGLRIAEFEIRSATRGPHAPALSGPAGGTVGVSTATR